MPASWLLRTTAVWPSGAWGVSLAFPNGVRLIASARGVTIQVQKVTKRYRDKRRRLILAVDAADLTVAAGETLMVAGPSGSGKTSLLRLIAGLEEPTQGQVLLDGRSVTAIRPAARGIFMLFQDALLYPNLSVYDNLAAPLMFRESSWSPWRWRRRREAVRDQVEGIARRFRIDGRLDALPEQLSRGERQRVALGRAILSRPAVLLLDEPLSNLEPELRFRLRLEITALREETGATVIHVTHDPFEAFTLGDRVAVLHRGRLQQVDRPERIYWEPANRFVAGFVGFPPMNFVAGWARAAGDGLWFQALGEGGGGLRLKMPSGLAVADGREIVAGIRPEHVEIVAGIRPEHVEIEAASDGSARRGFEALIRRVEKFGPEGFWHLEVSGVCLVARNGFGRLLPEAGRVRARLEESRVLWFDPESSERIV